MFNCGIVQMTKVPSFSFEVRVYQKMVWGGRANHCIFGTFKARSVVHFLSLAQCHICVLLYSLDAQNAD